MAGEAYTIIRHAIEQTLSADPGAIAEYLHTGLKNLDGLTGPVLGFDEKGDRLGTIHVAYVVDERGEFVRNPQQPRP